jgi:hypothetical protein
MVSVEVEKDDGCPESVANQLVKAGKVAGLGPARPGNQLDLELVPFLEHRHWANNRRVWIRESSDHIGWRPIFVY